LEEVKTVIPTDEVVILTDDTTTSAEVKGKAIPVTGSEGP
jgi:hypothetical protein